MALRFSCEDFDPVNCESSWATECRQHNESETQTVKTNFDEHGTQTVTSSKAAVQTEAPQSSASNFKVDKLAAWLTSIMPQVLLELDNTSNCRAFHGYKLQESNSDTHMKLLYTLHRVCDKSKAKGQTLTSQNIVSSVAWSCTGGVIAVSFCADSHPNWCDHSGHVLLYHISRQDFKPDTPYRKLELSSCGTVLSAHPTEPYILACGTFSGEVVVWNLQMDEAVILGSSSLHGEAVTHMEWIKDSDATRIRPLLASFSRDGTVFIWNVKLGTSSVKLAQSFLLQSETTDADLGVVCAAFSRERISYFIAGVDGGSILLCSTESKRSPRRRAVEGVDSPCFFDPIFANVGGHRGAVTGVKWSPSDGDTFLSCGTDSELHVYSLSQLCLLRTLYLSEPSLGMAICYPNCQLIASWGISGHVYLHNIQRNKETKLLLLTEATKHTPLTVVAFQGAGSSVVAAGNRDGKVLVWQLPLENLLEEET